MDTVYPQPVKLKLGVIPRRNRENRNRYRTQPVTFTEIKEVDEYNTSDEEDLNCCLSAESGPVITSKSSTSVNSHFDEMFARKRKSKLNRRNKFETNKEPTTNISVTYSTLPKNNIDRNTISSRNNNVQNLNEDEKKTTQY